MKIKIVYSIFLAVLHITLCAQNDLSKNNSEDKLTINSNDIIEALKMSGIEIHKFSIGEFDKKYKISFFVDEYKSDSLIQERVLYTGYITRREYLDENEALKIDYVSDVRVISKDGNEQCKLSIDLQGTALDREFSYTKTYNRQFYRWIPYAETAYQLGHKVPILAYISSWKEENGCIRHCGIKQLTEDGIDTREFFSKSPNYFIICYLVENE